MITMKRAGLRSAGLRLGALTACALLSGCPDPVEMSAQVNMFAAQPNPVPAPTNGRPSEFTIEWQADTQGKNYGYTYYVVAPSTVPATEDPNKVGIDWGKCTRGCDPATSKLVRCTSAVSTENPDDRVITCADTTSAQRPITLAAGQYTAVMHVYEDPSVVYHKRTFDAHAELPMAFR